MTRTIIAALLTLGDPDRLTGGHLYHRRLAALAPRHGVRLAFISFPERPFPLAAVDARRVLRRADRLGAEIFVLDSIAAAYLGPWLALHPPARPLVGMLHQPPGGIDHGPLRSGVQAALDRLAYRHASRLLVASDSLAAQLIAIGMPRAQIQTIPPGRDVPATAGVPVGDLRQGRRAAFLCVANWAPRKGIHDLLAAFARVPVDTGTLHLVGDDRADAAYAARLRERLAQPDLSGRVVVHGPVAVGRVAAFYAAADAFVLPSLVEPYGTVYGEAMAIGLPVVGWRSGNLPYLAEDGREGLLLDRGDIAGLAHALQRLARDEELRRLLGAAARRRALTWPTWDDSAALFCRVVCEAAGAAPTEQ